MLLLSLQYFSSAEMLERHKNDCFEINGKQMNKMSKKGGTAKFKKKLERLEKLFNKELP